MRIDVSYSQIAVFVADIAEPFNDWTELHVDQGFSWRPETVSFKTLKDGETEVRVKFSNQFELDQATVRAIQVPFSVPSLGNLEIASISDGFRAEIAAGEYALLFEVGVSEDGIQQCLLSFAPATKAEAKIVKADGGLKVPSNFLMNAEPA